MINLEEWVMIKHIYNQGVPKARIARELGLNPKTVDKAIKEDKPPQYERCSRNSILDPYKDYIKQRLDRYDLTATRILRDIKEQGYPGSYTILRYFVKQIKGDKPKPAFVRFETPPGEQAQADWSDFGYMEFDGKKTRLWCFSMVLGYSRTLYIQFFPFQSLVSLRQGHISAFRYFGGALILYCMIT